MGTWGHKAFQNDGASDWADELQTEGMRTLAASFEAVRSADYIEAPAAENAIAAAETLCACLGVPAAGLPEGITTWAASTKARPAASLIASAIDAVERVMADSELRELWAESPDFPAWESEVSSILVRLRAAPKPPRPWWKFWQDRH